MPLEGNKGTKTVNGISNESHEGEDLRDAPSPLNEDGITDSKTAIKSLPAVTSGPEMNTNPQQTTDPEPTSDEADWSIWTPSEKKMIILAAGIAAFFSPTSGQIYFPALNTIASDLRVLDSLVNLTITTYMIMQGLAPAFVGGLSDDAGRRPAYLVCFVVYIAANIGLALQNSYAALMVLRCLQSAGSSGTVALANAVVADIVTSSERGVYIAWTSIAPMVGPALGPIIGGLLAQYVGWHFIFWFLLILAGVVFVPMALFFPETCRKIVGDGSIPPPKWSRCYMNTISEKKAIKAGKAIPWEKRDELARKRRLRFPNPFRTLTVIFQRECGYALLYIALICNFNELQISLCYIPLGAGAMLAAVVRGRVIDSRYRYHAKRLGMPIVHNRRADLTDFPIERARIEVALPTLFLGCACQIGFGWTVQYKTNLAGPLILLFVIGFCLSATMNAIAVLVVDIYPSKAGTATAANNLLRCWLGAGATGFVVPMINAMGIGWTGTFFALVVVAFSPVLWYIMSQGPKWRRERKEKEERAKASKEAEANVGGGKG